MFRMKNDNEGNRQAPLVVVFALPLGIVVHVGGWVSSKMRLVCQWWRCDETNCAKAMKYFLVI